MSTRVLLCALFISAIAFGSVNRGPITRYDGPTKRIGFGQRVHSRVGAPLYNLIALDGHSILAGYGTGDETIYKPWKVVQDLTGRVTPSTFAVNGSRTSACVNRWANNIQDAGPDAGYSVLAWQCGVNNCIDNDPALTTQLAAQVAWDQVLDGGGSHIARHLILVSELPYEAEEQCLLDYNAFTLAYATAKGGYNNISYLNLYNVMSDGGAGLSVNYCLGASEPECLHPNDAGALYEGQQIAAAVDAGKWGVETGFGLAYITQVGLGTACACADITTDDGGSIQVDAGGGWCSRQGAWALTGIPNTDLVKCAAGKPIVMPKPSDGGLSIFVNDMMVNLTTYPKAIGTVDWATQGVVVAAPGVTTTAATAPNNANEATKVDLAATANNTQGSVLYNLNGCDHGSSARQTQGLYVKGVSGSGTMDICIYDGAGAGGSKCADCAFVSATWSRCINLDREISDDTEYFIFGNANYYTGSNTGRPAQSVYVWGADCITSRNVQPFVEGTKPAQAVSVAVTTSTGKISAALTYDAPLIIPTNARGWTNYWDSNNLFFQRFSTTSTVSFTIGGATTSTETAGTNMVVDRPNRLSGWYGVGVRSASVNQTGYNGTGSVQEAGTLALPATKADFFIGSTNVGTLSGNGYYSDIIVSSQLGAAR